MAIDITFTTLYENLYQLAIFVIAMTIYSIFIFKFYRFLAKKDLITFNLNKNYNNSSHWMIKSFFMIILHTIEYIILLPIFIFFWFSVLGVLLTFLAKGQSLDTILLVAMAVVGTVRIISYYNEDLSKDLAKMLPFALLGVFLIDINSFLLTDSWTLLLDIPNHISTLAYYLSFIILIEFVMRIISFIIAAFIPVPPKFE